MAYNPSNPNGQATSANSAPVVIASNQSAIPITDNSGSLTVDGTVTANAGTGSFTVAQSVAANLNATVTGTVIADTELPSAVTLSDGMANPSTPLIGTANLLFNGTTWKRLRGFTTHDNSSVNDMDVVLPVRQVAKRGSDTLLASVSSITVLNVSGASTVTITPDTSTTGTFVIEGTTNAAASWSNVEVFNLTSKTWVTGQDLSVTAGNVYSVLSGGLSLLRLRVTNALGAATQFTFVYDNTQQFIADAKVSSVNTVSTVGVVSAVTVGPAPHNFSFATVHEDGEYTTAQTGVAIWTPAAGKKFVITGLTVATGGTTAGIVTIWQSTTAIGDTTYSSGVDLAVFKGEFAPSANSKPGMVKSFPTPFVATTADYPLRVTTNAAMTVYIQVDGYEI